MQIFDSIFQEAIDKEKSVGNYWYEYIINGKIHDLRQLLQDVNFNPSNTTDGKTFLGEIMSAPQLLSHTDGAALVTDLINHPILSKTINTPDKYLITPLIYLVLRRHETFTDNLIYLLISNGADIYATDRKGNYAYWHILGNSNTQNVKYILDHKLDNKEEPKPWALFWAGARNTSDVLELLLQEDSYKKNINYESETLGYKTILEYLADTSFSKTFNTLLLAGADYKRQNTSGMNVIDILNPKKLSESMVDNYLCLVQAKIVSPVKCKNSYRVKRSNFSNNAIYKLTKDGWFDAWDSKNLKELLIKDIANPKIKKTKKNTNKI